MTDNTTTTTTSTSTLSPLHTVETILYKYEYSKWNEKEILSGSSDPNTVNNAFNKSLNFGILAPSETSEPLIIALRIKLATTIGQIKLGLVDEGGISFSTSTFGITASPDLYTNLTPSTYFLGVNTSSSETSPYNISVKNKTNQTSEYVYLNLTLPESQDFKTGTIRYKWFFDYTE